MHKPTENILIGAVSGILSYGFVRLGSDSNLGNPLFYGPGLVFGTIFGLYFHRSEYKTSLIKIVLFVGASTASYFAAVFTTLNTNAPSLPFALVVGGLVGSFLLTASIRLLLCEFSTIKFFLITFIGAILGLTWYLLPLISLITTGSSLKDVSDLSLFSLFFFWQIGMSLGIGWYSTKQSTN